MGALMSADDSSHAIPLYEERTEQQQHHALRTIAISKPATVSPGPILDADAMNYLMMAENGSSTAALPSMAVARTMCHIAGLHDLTRSKTHVNNLYTCLHDLLTSNNVQDTAEIFIVAKSFNALMRCVHTGRPVCAAIPAIREDAEDGMFTSPTRDEQHLITTDRVVRIPVIILAEATNATPHHDRSTVYTPYFVCHIPLPAFAYGRRTVVLSASEILHNLTTDIFTVEATSTIDAPLFIRNEEDF